MLEPVLDVEGCRLAQGWPDEGIQLFLAAGGLFSQIAFELTPQHLDWIEVRRVGGQEDQRTARLFDHLLASAGRGDFCGR